MDAIIMKAASVGLAAHDAAVAVIGLRIDGDAVSAALSAALFPMLMVTVLVWCAMPPRGSRLGHLAGTAYRAGASPPRTGLAPAIAAVIAHVRNGGDTIDAFEEQGGRRFAVRELTIGRVRMMLQARATDEERDEVNELAGMTVAACALSRTLGCSMVRCLEAVVSRHRHIERMRRLRESAFAMPRSTVRLLSGLPVLTVAIGTVLGARPLSFLLDGGAGSLCLAAGLWCHALGTLWMRAMFDKAREDMDGDFGSSGSTRRHKSRRVGTSIRTVASRRDR